MGVGSMTSFAQRAAINTIVQGGSADIIKKAMVDIFRSLRNTPVQMIMQVHDELIFEVPEKELDSYTASIKEQMQNAVTLRVPLVVSAKAGPNWYELKKLAYLFMKFTTPHKLTIGLTGGILCGKSAALAAWKKAGAFVLSCDELVREISIRPPVQKKIQRILGCVNNKQIAKRIFSEDCLRVKLETILHPLVFKEIQKRLQHSSAKVRVVEVPLLFETNLQNAFDLTVALGAPDKVLSARARKRGMKKADLLKRQQAQLPPMEKLSRADICIINDATLEKLTQKINALHRAMRIILDNK